VRYLFELTLKATVAGCDTDLTRTVLYYAKNHNYLISVDERTARYALLSTYPHRPMQGDYSILRVLTDCEVTFKIAVTEVNREQIELAKKRETKNDVSVHAVVLESLKASRTNSRVTSRASSRDTTR